MLAWLRQRETLRQRARSLYGSIVTQARSPILYRAWGVPDSNEGRFELITLHMVLALRRIGTEGEAGHVLGRALTELFVVDLDDTFREMSVGDLAVPRHVKRAVAVLYDRHAAYGAAFESGQESAKESALDEAVSATLGGLKGAEALDVAAISSYIRQAGAALDSQSGDAVLGGQLAWPEVQARSGEQTGAS